MDIHTATTQYEAWLAGYGPLFASDLAHKHEAMADPDDPFPFFRGTYYRWPHLWRSTCPHLADAPRVLAVGDLHVENFGLWRDLDGRLCWGVNDFDEADELPYTNDLVRLAASVLLARTDGGLSVKPKVACEAIRAGYRQCLGEGGDPFVLEERHPDLRILAYDGDPPAKFWKKLDKVFDADWPDEIPLTPAKAKAALREGLPAGAKPMYRPRLKVGMGSLGKPRYMARLKVAGGWLAREVKRVTPPTTAWDTAVDVPSRSGELARQAIRSADPFYRAGKDWVTRRIGPKAIRIGLGQLANADDLEVVLHAMGAETANVHLGTKGTAKAIRKHLDSQPAEWLRDAAKAMAAAVTEDWQAWRR